MLAISILFFYFHSFGYGAAPVPLTNKKSFGDDNTCAICLESMKEPVLLPCGHWLCASCLANIRTSATVQDVCAICRQDLPLPPDKLFKLGVRYQFIERNYRQAFECYEQAAAQGHASSYTNLGLMCSQKKIHEFYDLDKARYYFSAAAEKREPSALNNLGCLYDNGSGIQDDLDKSLKYFRLAAGYGSACAHINLSFMYASGRGVEQDFVRSEEYWREVTGTPERYPLKELHEQDLLPKANELWKINASMKLLEYICSHEFLSARGGSLPDLTSNLEPWNQNVLWDSQPAIAETAIVPQQPEGGWQQNPQSCAIQ